MTEKLEPIEGENIKSVLTVLRIIPDKTTRSRYKLPRRFFLFLSFVCCEMYTRQFPENAQLVGDGRIYLPLSPSSQCSSTESSGGPLTDVNVFSAADEALLAIRPQAFLPPRLLVLSPNKCSVIKTRVMSCINLLDFSTINTDSRHKRSGRTKRDEQDDFQTGPSSRHHGTYTNSSGNEMEING